MASELNSPRSLALYSISQARFHRRFILPATPEHDELAVTYADVGVDPHSAAGPVPTILFIPGMFASRYLGVLMHAIAEKVGVRVVLVDRPGMGGSTPVPLVMRVPVWRELVPRLLHHLSTDRVSLVSHSAGIIYLLNTLFHCRDILHPHRPYIAFLAPWVDPTHSRVTAMQIAQLIPTQAFRFWNQIPRFFQLKASPVFESSSAVISNLRSSFPFTRSSQDYSPSTQPERNRLRIQESYGIARELQAELEKYMVQFLFQEETVGANDEALLCLKKGPEGAWGVCESYDQCMKDLATMERRRRRTPPEPYERSNAETGMSLNVHAYFAESDAMVGKKGQSYFEDCWKGQNHEYENILQFEATTIPGENHDSLCTSSVVLEALFQGAHWSFHGERPDRA